MKVIRLLTLIAAILVTALEAGAQTLIGKIFVGGQQQVVSIDPATGATSPLFTFPAGSPDMTVVGVDPVEQRLFLEAFVNFGDIRLFVLNLRTNTLTETPFRTDNPKDYVYDPATRTLLALGFFTGQQQIVRIDPATGATTLVMTLPNAIGMDLAAFDPLQQRLFLQGFVNFGDIRLYIANLGSGTLTETPFQRDNPLQYLFDPGSNSLLALGFFSGQQRLVRVDTATGGVTTLLTMAASPAMRIAAFDAAQRRIFLEGFVNFGDLRLYIVNLATNTLTETPFGTDNPVQYAFLPAVVPVPASSSAAMVLLIAAIAAIAVRAIT
jgi:DNA-binding beta-propeller fold protein YncE